MRVGVKRFTGCRVCVLVLKGSQGVGLPKTQTLHGTGCRVWVLASRVQGFGSASERREKNVKRSKELHLKAKV
jgi:hypothetical protein